MKGTGSITITFYLNSTDGEEVRRIANYRRIGPHEWCKKRIIAIIGKKAKKRKIRK